MPPRALASGLILLALLWGRQPSVPAAEATTATISAVAVATGLQAPAAFTFAPDGRIFYGERFTGQIRIFDPVTHSDTLFFTIHRVLTAGEQGLLGLALHPGYPSPPFVYAYATRNVQGTSRNQILRIRDAGGVGSSMRAIFTGNTRAGGTHNGGRILFGPDGKLYALVGNGGNAHSQDLTVTAGKVLRMNPDGSVPADNPMAGSLIFAYGIRNSFGFTFDPQTGNLWETENGPECNDEINLVPAGANLGWGLHSTCSTPPDPPRNTNQDGPDPALPLQWFTPTIVPTGAAFCQACGLPGGEGSLFFATFHRSVHQDTLTADRKGVAGHAIVFRQEEHIFSMERGPDGGLYISDTGGNISRLVPA